MSRIARITVLLAALIALVAGFTACGGGGADKLLKDTFSGKKKFDSGKINIALTVDAQGVAGLPGPVALKITGPFETQGPKRLPKFALVATINAAGQSFNAGATATQDNAFLALQGSNYEVPNDVFAQFKKGFEQGQEGESRGTLSSFGIQPLNWAENPQDKGTQKIGGADTTHIAAKINVGKFIDDLNKILDSAARTGGNQTGQVPSKITAQEKKRIQDSVKEATFDVFTNKSDKTFRKIDVKIKLQIPEAQRQRSGGLQSANIDFIVEVDDLNKPQTIVAPTSPRPFSELVGTLQSLGLFGGGKQPSTKAPSKSKAG